MSEVEEFETIVDLIALMEGIKAPEYMVLSPQKYAEYTEALLHVWYPWWTPRHSRDMPLLRSMLLAS